MANSGRAFRVTIAEIDPIKDTTIDAIVGHIITGNDRDKVATSLDRLFHELLDQVVPTEE